MKNRLLELITVFGRLGLIAFGGPAAHVGMMEKEVVTKRGWMTREYFLDLLGATNLIPGPNSTEMTMHCGYERAGWKGLIVAGTAFILPAVVLTGILAWLYSKYGQLPELSPFVAGIKPAVLVIIGEAIFKLGKKAWKGWKTGLIGMLTLAAALFGLREIYAILLAGAAGVLWLSGMERRKLEATRKGETKSTIPLLLFSGSAASTAVSGSAVFLVFLKIGAVLFGSGYVLVAYLDGELVDRLGWMTEPQLLDAIAIGQFTPGPVLSTATFIGYQIAGWSGAILATLGIFLPSFIFVWLLNPWIPKLRRSPVSSSFLDGVNMGAVAIMLDVSIDLGQSLLTDLSAWIIASASLLATLVVRDLPTPLLVVGGAVAGYLLHLSGWFA